MSAHDSGHLYHSSVLLFLTDILNLFKVPCSCHTQECIRLHFYGNDMFYQRNKRHVTWLTMKTTKVVRINHSKHVFQTCDSFILFSAHLITHIRTINCMSLTFLKYFCLLLKYILTTMQKRLVEKDIFFSTKLVQKAIWNLIIHC